MRLELENVGKIESANIKLDGITVIQYEKIDLLKNNVSIFKETSKDSDSK